MKLRKSSLLSKIIILALIVYATVTLISLRDQIATKQASSEQLEQQISSLQQQNQHLADQIEALGTVEGVKEIARNKLGLVTEGEIVFYDIGS